MNAKAAVPIILIVFVLLAGVAAFHAASSIAKPQPIPTQLTELDNNVVQLFAEGAR